MCIYIHIIYIYIYIHTIIWREYRGEKYAGHQRFYARKVYLLFDVLNVFSAVVIVIIVVVVTPRLRITYKLY